MYRMAMITAVVFILANVAQADVVTIEGVIKSVDANQRTITVETNSESKTLDVSRKAKVSVDNKVEKLDTLKPGQKAKLSYHDDLEIVLKIEVGLMQPLSDFLKLVSVTKIWDRSRSNQFTDLCVCRDQFYCVFREGRSRLSPRGTIRILRSDNGRKWESVGTVQLAGFDLRDPKLSPQADQTLMLTAGASQRKGGKLLKLNTVSVSSKDGLNWSEPANIGERDMWLWNPVRNAEVTFAVGYHAKDPWFTRLYRSGDGSNWDIIVDRLQTENMPVEAALAFDTKQKAVCVLRRGAGSKTAMLGVSRPPYDIWNWHDTAMEIASPDLLTLEDGRMLLAARLKEATTQTTLMWLDTESLQLTKALTLPGGRDQGYPGIVQSNDHIWVSYHSSHEGTPSIYIAQLNFAD